MTELTEVAVDSVRVHAPTGQHVAVLKDSGGERYLPIFIGSVEATSIALHLDGAGPERPLTHDLLVDIMGLASMTLRRVVITSPGNEIYHARLLGEMNGRRFEVDARASDAVALAVRTGARLYVVTSVLERSSISRPDGGPGEDERLSVLRNMINAMDLPSLEEPTEGP